MNAHRTTQHNSAHTIFHNDRNSQCGFTLQHTFPVVLLTEKRKQVFIENQMSFDLNCSFEAMYHQNFHTQHGLRRAVIESARFLDIVMDHVIS